MTEYFIECIKKNKCLWNTTILSNRDVKAKEEAWNEVTRKANMPSVAASKIRWKGLRDTHRAKLKQIREGKTVKTWPYMSHMDFLVPFVSNKTDNSENSQFNTATSPRAGNSNDHQRKRKSKEDSLKAFFNCMYKSTAQLPLVCQRNIKKQVFTLVMETEESIGVDWTGDQRVGQWELGGPVEIKDDVIDLDSTTDSDYSFDAVIPESVTPVRNHGFSIILDDDSDVDTLIL